MKLLSKTITPLLGRVIVFLCLFLVITGLSGPRIIDNDIMSRDGFAYYGGIGKALIFGVIAFVLLARRTKAKVSLRPWRPALLGWLGVALLSFMWGWSSIDSLLVGERTPLTLLGAHGGLLGSLVFAALSCFGLPNIQTLFSRYQQEIVRALGMAVAFYIFLLVVYALWQPLASVVLFCVNSLLGVTGLQATILPPHTLMFDQFGITIAEFCSGVESIALFTSLYAVVGLLDWHRLNKRRYFMVFPFALLVLFGLNIVRVYGLIMAGYHIDPGIAFSLFHTYAGMVFFILYSAAFWVVAYKHLLNKPTTEISHEKTTGRHNSSHTA